MDNLLKKHDTRIRKIVADSEYESEENYLYLRENKIKPLN